MSKLTPEEVLQALKDGKQVEIKASNDKWEELRAYQHNIACLLNEANQFRLAQEMMTIGDVSFPKPESKPLVNGCAYYYVNPLIRELHTVTYWKGDEVDMLLLAKNLVHISKENAIAHAKALIKLSGGSYE